MKKQATSNELIQAMMDQQLEANEIKVVLAYVSLGGWKEGQEVFLPESVIAKYNMNKTTIKRHRKSLIAKGWMIPTGNKSMFGVDMYRITIPAPVQGGPICTPGETNLDQGVDQNGLGGGPLWSTEVIKEVTKESNEVSNKEERSARRASQPAVVPPADSTLNQKKNNKDDQGTTGATRRLDTNLIGYEVPAPEPVLMGATNKGVDQNDLPYTLDENGDLVW